MTVIDGGKRKGCRLDDCLFRGNMCRLMGPS